MTITNKIGVMLVKHHPYREMEVKNERIFFHKLLIGNVREKL